MRLTGAASISLAAVLYCCGLALVTLSPLTDWRFIPQVPWEYLDQPWPRYWTGFDLMVNVVAYIPFGLLASRAITRRLGHTGLSALWGFVLATLAGCALSVILESLQTYLPSRRPSVLDVTANTLGSIVGAFFASAYSQSIASRVRASDSRPIEIGGLMLAGVWIVAQSAPQQIWLALGDVIASESWRPVMDWFANRPSSLAAAESFAAQRILAEALCVASALLSAALVMHLTLLQSTHLGSRYRAKHWLYLLIVVVLVTLSARALWIGLLLSPQALVTWFTAGVQAGVVLAILSGYALAALNPPQQRLAAMLSLLALLALANTLPANGYAEQAYAAWSGGRWFNLQLLANLSASLWPFAALGWLGLALNRFSKR